MSLYALLDSQNFVVEIIECNNVDQCYHPDVVKMMVKCDGDVCCGWHYENNVFSKPKHQEMIAEPFQMQYAAIDAHISASIKSRDFDDIGQVALCCVDGNGYQIEALAVSAWVLKCWHIQEQIKSSEVKYDSVDDAIKALPPFDISE